MEALGYRFRSRAEANIIQALCETLRVIPLDDAIVQKTIEIRKSFNIKLPDAIILATAIEKGLPLVTRNVSDFKAAASGHQIIDPK
jgi:predicted nucleic acid-binding protein